MDDKPWTSMWSSLKSAVPPLRRSRSSKAAMPTAPSEQKPAVRNRFQSLSRAHPQPMIDSDAGLHMDCSAQTQKFDHEAMEQNDFGISQTSLGKIDSAMYAIIPDKLYISFHPSKAYTMREIVRHPDLFFMSTAYHESNSATVKGFNAVDIGTICRFCEALRTKAANPGICDRAIVYYTRCNLKEQSNAVLLLALYLMLEHKYPADKAARCFCSIPEYPFQPYSDSHSGVSIHDGLTGFEKILAAGWFDIRQFDVGRHELLSHPSSGSMCLVGDKFLVASAERSAQPPAFYARRFAQMGVSTVVRLNPASAKEEAWSELELLDLHTEGGCPTAATIQQFLDTCDAASGVVAVHCHAGPDCAGVMVALWMVKNLKMSAREATGWVLMLRAGALVGAQRGLLVEAERARWEGNLMLPPASRSLSWPLSFGLQVSSGWPGRLKAKKETVSNSNLQTPTGKAERPKQTSPLAGRRLQRKTLVRLSHPGSGHASSSCPSEAGHSPSRSPSLSSVPSAAHTPLTLPASLRAREPPATAIGAQYVSLRRASTASYASRRTSM